MQRKAAAPQHHAPQHDAEQLTWPCSHVQKSNCSRLCKNANYKKGAPLGSPVLALT
jgi:hypothetical protein